MASCQFHGTWRVPPIMLRWRLSTMIMISALPIPTRKPVDVVKVTVGSGSLHKNEELDDLCTHCYKFWHAPNYDYQPP